MYRGRAGRGLAAWCLWGHYSELRMGPKPMRMGPEWLQKVRVGMEAAREWRRRWEGECGDMAK